MRKNISFEFYPLVNIRMTFWNENLIIGGLIVRTVSVWQLKLKSHG